MTPLAIALIVLVAMFLLGLPIFMSLIISSVVAILAGGDILPLSVIHNSLFDGLNLFPLLAIPCFVVAGTLMEFGNITQQIVDVVKQLVGRVYGGLGITTILACTFFAAISGSGPGTVAAVGTILVPAMVRNGYSKDYASAAASSGGTIGILIPPSNPMIIYAILGNLSVTAMFTAGFIPGFIVAFAMIMTAYLLAKRNGFKGDENAAPFNMKFFLRSCGNAGFALATPFIILGSIYTGWATPVEASVVAIVWALFVGIVINRVLRPRHIYRALLEGAMTCGAVLLIVGASTLFGKILTFEEAPQRLASIVLGISDDPHLVLLMIIGVLYVLLHLGILNTLTGVIVVAIALRLPGSTFIIRNFFAGIPQDIENSALVDGCNRLTAFFQVIIHMVKPGLASISIFAFMSAWSNYLLFNVLIFNTKTPVLATYLRVLSRNDQMIADYGVFAAMAMVYMLPVLIFFFISQRQLMQGTISGGKGI